jgi:hypothetical protein
MTIPAQEATHWADQAAAAAIAAGRPVIVSSGISPSGEIHIGNMREVLTADAVFRAGAGSGRPRAVQLRLRQLRSAAARLPVSRCGRLRAL